MRSAISFNNRQDCGAATLALFLIAKPDDVYLSSRRFPEGVFVESIVEWPIIAPVVTEQERSGNLPMPSILLVSSMKNPDT